jgi:hypothetical protein
MLRALLLSALVLGSGNAFAQSCNRECLRTTLDQYLKALVQHDFGKAPLSVGFRETENAVVTLLGAGLWQSATALGNLERR